jgi:hypothetical protein
MPELLIQLLQQPGHVDAEVFHGGYSFLVLFHFSDLTSDGEEMVHGVECVDGSTSSDGHDCRAGYALEHVTIYARHETDTVNDLTRDKDSN